MSIKKITTFVYYSHILLVSLAMVLTGTISAILYGQLSWQVILLVGLSTYLTYSLDNLIDWKKDQSHYEGIKAIVQTYHKISYILIPGSAIGIYILIINSSNELQTGILLLGAAVAMSTTRFSGYRNKSSSESQKIFAFLLNRTFISLIWTTVCVFLPIWYANLPVIPLTWHTFLYMYVLILSYAIIWKLEKSPATFQKEIFSSWIPKGLAGLSFLPLFLVFYDIIIGYAPVQNLVNLAPAVASLVGLVQISRNPIDLQIKISILTLILIGLCTISAIVHLSLV